MIEKIGVGGRWSDVGMAEQFRGLAADRLREVLGIETFERLTAEGAALSVEQAVALARLPPTPL